MEAATPAHAREWAANTEKNTMIQKIESVQKNAKTLGYILIGLAILTVVFVEVSFYSKASEATYGAYMLCGMVLIILGGVYVNKYSAIKKTKKKNSPEAVRKMQEGTWNTSPTYSKSKVYCGEHAIFCEKNNALLPYDGMA